MVLHKRISSDEQFEKQRKDPRTGYEEFVKIVKVGLLSLVQICTIWKFTHSLCESSYNLIQLLYSFSNKSSYIIFK